MLLKAMEYNYEIEYRPGKSMFVSDHLSRSPLKQSMSDNQKSDSVHSVVFDVNVITHWLNEIRDKTFSDPTLQKLATVIKTGWPESITSLPAEVRPYHSYCDELSVDDGLIFRADRIVIPSSMRNDMKKRVHAAHQGLNSCFRRASAIIFWPQMSKEITAYIEACGTCSEFQHKKQSPEPLIMHDVPSHAFEKVGCDVYTIKDRNYLVTVDYATNFFEIDYLPTVTTNTVVARLKSHFARYGIPTVLVTDNGSIFKSEEFRKFVKSCQISHETSSPHFSQSNGQAESAVKTAKKMMIRCAKSHDDPYLAYSIFEIRPLKASYHHPLSDCLENRRDLSLPCQSHLYPCTLLN